MSLPIRFGHIDRRRPKSDGDIEQSGLVELAPGGEAKIQLSHFITAPNKDVVHGKAWVEDSMGNVIPMQGEFDQPVPEKKFKWTRKPDTGTDPDVGELEPPANNGSPG